MLNKVTLIGHLGADPVIRYTQQGKPVASFSVATSEPWKDKKTGEKKERTEWHRCVCFSEKLCEIIEKYLKKGAKIYLEGQNQTRKWQDKDGNDRYSTEVVLQGFNAKLVMLDSKGDGRGTPEAEDYGLDPDRAAGSGPTADDHRRAKDPDDAGQGPGDEVAF